MQKFVSSLKFVTQLFVGMAASSTVFVAIYWYLAPANPAALDGWSRLLIAHAIAVFILAFIGLLLSDRYSSANKPLWNWQSTLSSAVLLILLASASALTLIHVLDRPLQLEFVVFGINLSTLDAVLLTGLLLAALPYAAYLVFEAVVSLARLVWREFGRAPAGTGQETQLDVLVLTLMAIGGLMTFIPFSEFAFTPSQALSIGPNTYFEWTLSGAAVLLTAPTVVTVVVHLNLRTEGKVNSHTTVEIKALRETVKIGLSDLTYRLAEVFKMPLVQAEGPAIKPLGEEFDIIDYRPRKWRTQRSPGMPKLGVVWRSMLAQDDGNLMARIVEQDVRLLLVLDKTTGDARWFALESSHGDTSEDSQAALELMVDAAAQGHHSDHELSILSHDSKFRETFQVIHSGPKELRALIVRKRSEWDKNRRDAQEDGFFALNLSDSYRWFSTAYVKTGETKP